MYIFLSSILVGIGGSGLDSSIQSRLSFFSLFLFLFPNCLANPPLVYVICIYKRFCMICWLFVAWELNRGIILKVKWKKAREKEKRSTVEWRGDRPCRP
ncbi:hypothetical protein F5X99DRAFT_253565 [Biscogniauxia marginata]|nr:hypothetical protein F5X99DRAFT_253565 [Biscogniauxia marginata]